jgi:ZIP family zinc transporter
MFLIVSYFIFFMEELLLIISLLVAGPILGSLLGIIKRPSERVMFHLLAFAAGVMISIAFLQLIPQALLFASVWTIIAGVLIGTALMFLLDRFLPHIHPETCVSKDSEIKKLNLFLFAGMFLHSFPEGMAIATGLFSNIQAGIAIAFTITIHKIPESIAIASAQYYCTKSKLNGFLKSVSTLLPLLFGFGISFLIYQTIPREAIGFIIGITAGLMIYISGDELIPESSEKLTYHKTIFSFVAGICIVLLSNMKWY